MLTFEFTDADGKMTVNETLTSGMVGRRITIVLDDHFQGLSSYAVFRAGQACKVLPIDHPVLVIPQEVLARPFLRFHVGVYATDSSGSVVIPTVMADGPYIRYGADPFDAPDTENLPVWKKIQEQIGNLANLRTEARGNLVAAINSLVDRSFSRTAAKLLITVLRHGHYDSSQTANIDALEGLLLSGSSESETPGDGEDPEPTSLSVTYLLTNTYSGNSAGSVTVGSPFSTTLTAPEGYEISSVTVTMGDTDITASAYANGVVAIPSVTGNVVITAESGEVRIDKTYSVVNYLSHVVTDNDFTTANHGEYYGACLTPDNGHALNSVTVTMGGVDITSWAYNNSYIDIISVTGNIVITASAIAQTD